MADATVRAADAADAGLIAALQLAVWRQAYAQLLPSEVLTTEPAELGARWTARIGAGGPVLLAFEGAVPVGFAALHDGAALGETGVGETALGETGVGEIEVLHVVARWTRRGHGGRLFGEATGRLRAGGAGSGFWWAPESDVSVERFLAGVGWWPDGARRVLQTATGGFAEIRYRGGLDLVLI